MMILHPETIKSVAESKLAAPGASYRDLAELHGCSHSSIARALNTDQAREIIEIGLQQQIALIPKAIDILTATLHQSDDPSLRYKAAQDVLRNTGLAPTGGNNVMINNVLNLHAQDIHIERAAEAALTHLGIIDVTPAEPSDPNNNMS
jgi:lambda repressor-like predicted transcriptional regulator